MTRRHRAAVAAAAMVPIVAIAAALASRSPSAVSWPLAFVAVADVAVVAAWWVSAGGVR